MASRQVPPCPIILQWEVVVVDRGCGQLRALLAPLFAAFDALRSIMDGDVELHLLAAAWGHLLASLG
jgi:hypothetical protein